MQQHDANGVRDPSINPKLTRLRRACDMCSMRKVKCDDSNIPCRPCRELGVDCTYNRETKRRGPPNKHAEASKAAKRARMEMIASHDYLNTGTDGTQSIPGSIPGGGTDNNAGDTAGRATPRATVPLLAAGEGLTAESIAPMHILELLVDDFFTYIHPLAPFPHEPSFRAALANREDRTRPEFLGLLASMIATLVSSFPRTAREVLKAENSTHLFPKAILLIEKCHDVVLATRGPMWVFKQPKTMDDAATSYFMGLSSIYILQVHAARHFMAETLLLIRELGFNRSKHERGLPTFGHDPNSADPGRFNHIRDQIGKRIFYCLLLGVRSMFQFDKSHSDIVIAPSTPNMPYPAYPENVDDSSILADEIIHAQPESSVTLLTGFRFGIDIYTTINGVVALELAYGMSTLPWADQRILLRDGLVAAKSIIDDLPPELQLGTPAAEASDAAAHSSSTLGTYGPPAWPLSGSGVPTPSTVDLRTMIKQQPQHRRLLQYEIQKANVFVSQLTTRSYFVELYFNLRDIYLREQTANGSPETAHHQSPEEQALMDADDKDILDFMSDERDLVIQDLLTVLGSISQRNIEPNGGSIVAKIRQVASTLLHDSQQRKGGEPGATKTEGTLAQLIEVLITLEKMAESSRTRVHDPNGDTVAQEEEEELRTWAALREYQQRLAEASEGFDMRLTDVSTL